MKYSSYSESPDKFHFWTAVATIAGALRRKVWIDCAYWQWVPNFYIIFVAPPGIVAKSTTAGIGMNLLRKVPKINFGSDVSTWEALVQSLAKSREVFTTPDNRFLKMSAITCVASELGTFLNPQNREQIDALVSLWDSAQGEWKKTTKTQGSDTIINPWLNLIGCTTPAWISGAFPEYMIGGGFTSRAIFVYADRKRQLVAYPKRVMNPRHASMTDDLIADLTKISTLSGAYELTDANILHE